MKFGLLKKLLATALIGASLTAITAHAEDLLDQVKQRGTLRIGLEGTFPPFNSKAPSGELVGYDVDIAKAVAAKLGVKPEFVTTEWSGIIAGLQAGKFDVIVNQVGITDARKQTLDFSPAYTYSAAQLIQRKNDTRQFTSLEDLKGKKLGVGLGTNYMLSPTPPTSMRSDAIPWRARRRAKCTPKRPLPIRETAPVLSSSTAGARAAAAPSGRQ